jgi:hypothetical protein
MFAYRLWSDLEWNMKNIITFSLGLQSVSAFRAVFVNTLKMLQIA